MQCHGHSGAFFVLSVKALLVFLLANFISARALALSNTAPAYTYETYDYNQSAADLGRGGVHDYSPTNGLAMLANPAILGFVSGFHATLANVQLGASGTTTITNVQNAVSSSSSTSIDNYFGENVWAGGTGSTCFEFPYIGIAAYKTAYVDAWASDPAYPAFNVEGIYDTGYVIGTALPFGKEFAMGFNFKQISRQAGLVSIGASSIANFSTVASTDLKAFGSGTGYGVDWGMLYRSEAAVHPTFSLDWKDAGWVTFTPTTTGGTAPTPLEDNLIAAFEVSQSYLGFGWRAGAEFRHLLNWDVDTSKKINLGLELDLGIVEPRMGLYEGYFTYGASIDLWILTLDAAEYSVERGIYAGQQQDSRFQIGLRVEAGLDPDFLSLEIGGKRRRLKQRR